MCVGATLSEDTLVELFGGYEESSIEAAVLWRQRTRPTS